MGVKGSPRFARTSPDTVKGSRFNDRLGTCEADYASASFCRLDGHQLSVIRHRLSGQVS
ncbi:protein of unknown function (plasmid) [Azospirillum baldaniorum]|uniref:Uncharacterized protein n=1 Tax=Azospirillum baldaniorum TaxID=1064539 RepID=A0A9P1JV66_9PROT|nr:protein of unknown function [Azospirillum baldaniorum]